MAAVGHAIGRFAALFPGGGLAYTSSEDLQTGRRARARIQFAGRNFGEPVFQHILIPTDLTDRTGRAADMARDLARSAPARITLLHVIETVSGASYDEFASFYQEIEGRASRHLIALASRFEGPGLEIARTVVYGKPAEEIVGFAVREHVDLIVLASHRIDLSRPGYGWGTLSYRIGVLAPCPVLLVK